MSFRGRGRGGRNNYNAFPRQTMETDQQLEEITFKHWNQASQSDLLSFIFRKSGVQLQNTYVTRDILHGFVLPEHVRQVEAYNGVKFAGQSLSIRAKNQQASQPQQSQGTNSTIDTLKQCLQPRYNPQSRMLNLSNMRSDPILSRLGSFTPSKMFGALMKIAGDNNEYTIESVDLSQNMLQDIANVTTLSQSIPNLKNLSLANNQISRTQSLEAWRHKFPHLRELILSGNPIANQPGYKDEIMKLFTKLIMLDGQVIRDETQIAIPRLPHPMKQAFFENPNVENVANGFLNSYFQLFDSDRTQLLQLYDNLSMFSISVDNGAPRLLSHGGPAQWSAYIPMSRNLIKITALNARQNRMYVGTETIANAFRRLPASKHDFQPGKFAIDVWCANNIRQAGDTGVTISLHGEMTEPQNSNQMRSFDRTFVVLQGPNGEMIVASDMVTYRSYAGVEAWKENLQAYQQSQPQPNNVAPAAAAAASAATAAVAPMGATPPELNGLNPEQLDIVQKLMQATRLNAQYARMCAEQAQFNAQQAMALFEQSRATLPPNAFQ